MRQNLRLGLLLCSIISMGASCSMNEQKEVIEGEKLANIYCSSCHIKPDPSVADIVSWKKGILPKMHEKIVTTYLFASNEVKEKLVPNKEQWTKIVTYYTSLAYNGKQTQSDTSSIDLNLQQFTAHEIINTDARPNISFLKFINLNGIAFIASDALTKKLYVYNDQFKLENIIHSDFTTVDMVQRSNGDYIATDIGILSPNDNSVGQIYNFHKSAFLNKGELKFDLLMKGLKRPVFTKEVDLNNDGKLDLLVGQFGNTNGELAWFELKSNNTYEKHVLHATPGSINTKLIDLNHDGLMDIVTLFAQGDESIRYYQNKGKGQFSEEVLLRFPPIYGSSSFDMVDMNQDGLLDIVYTCGDNADYSTILKPYHGVYIFTNQGSNQFKQSYFYPINGCYKAIPLDFDKDGDIDIASIAYFADYKQKPEEGFVYFENNGKGSFSKHTNTSLQKGRWLTMDAGDYNHDGYIDLAIGNFSYLKSFVDTTLDWSKGPQCIILTNKGKK